MVHVKYNPWDDALSQCIHYNVTKSQTESGAAIAMEEWLGRGHCGLYGAEPCKQPMFKT